jgi:hypothetical protein
MITNLRTMDSCRELFKTMEILPFYSQYIFSLYSSPTIVRVIKSRRLRWAGHVARMETGEVCAGFWWRNLRERDHSGNAGVDGRIILRWIFKK